MASRPPPSVDPAIIRKARTALELVESKPQKALKKIEKLCGDHSDVAVLFRTQAQILEKCYDEATDLDKKKRLMKNAIKCAKKAITLSPNSMYFNSFLGYLYYKRSVNSNDFKKAIQQFNTALNIPRPSDPAQETLFTNEKMQSYEARIEVARKCILQHIGNCLSKLRELGENGAVKECLDQFGDYTVREKLYLVWPIMSLSQKRHHCQEWVEGTVPDIPIKNAATGTDELRRPLKMKEPIVDNQEEWDQTPMTRASCPLKVKEPVAKLPLADIEVPRERVRQNVEIGDYKSFEELLQLRSNIVILTGHKVLKPECYVSHICHLRENMSRVFQNGPMALVLVPEEVDYIISLFPKDCPAATLTSKHLIGIDVAVGTPTQLRNYLLRMVEEAEDDFLDVRFIAIVNTDDAFMGPLRNNDFDMFVNMKAVQVMLVNSWHSRQVAELRSLFSAPWEIVDLRRNRIL